MGALVDDPDFIEVQGLAAGAHTRLTNFDIDQAGLRERVRRAIIRGASEYNAFLGRGPVFLGVPDWAAATTYPTFTHIHKGGLIYQCTWSRLSGSGAANDTGQSGSTGPSGTGDEIADGTVIWAYVGRRAAMARSNSLVLYAGDVMYQLGKSYECTGPGTTAGSDPGDLGNGQAITDGTATLRYIGPQDLPVISLSASGDGTLSRVSYAENSYNDANGGACRVWQGGGTSVKVGANVRWQFPCYDAVGGAGPYTTSDGGEGAFLAWSAMASKAELGTVGGGTVAVWKNARLVAIAIVPSAATWIWLDNSNMLQRLDDYGFTVSANIQIGALKVPANGILSEYVPTDPIKVGVSGDSFYAGTGEARKLSFMHLVSRTISPCNTRIFAVGGVGMLRRNGSTGAAQTGALASMNDRWAFDALAPTYDVLLHGLSQNDFNVSSDGLAGFGVTYTLTDLINTTTANLQAVLDQGNNPIIVVASLWNNRQALVDANQVAFNAGVKAWCDANAARGVIWGDWSSLLLDGGYAGNPGGTGSSRTLTIGDGTHPTAKGHFIRAAWWTNLLRKALGAFSVA